MSCNCNAKYDNKIPCCCSTGTAVVCTTTICPNTQPCNQTVESDCVIYDKDHQCIGITSGMQVTEVVDIILDKLNLINCTTTIAPTCNCYLLINNTAGSLTYRFTPCGGSLSGNISLPGNQRNYRCSSTIPSADAGIVVGTLSNLNCSLGESTCISPNSYCHTITVQGAGTFQYINSAGTLVSVTISSGLLKVCALKNSIDKTSGTGTYTITETDNICDTSATC